MQKNSSGPPQPPTIISTYHLRVIFFQYETTYLLTHSESCLKQIQRHCPEFQLELPTMEIYHSLIQFQSTPLTKIPAYQLFPIQVQLIHSFNPSQLYFLAILDNQETLFPQSFQLLNPLQKSGTKTLLALNRFNALRGTTPLLPTQSVQVPTIVTIPTQSQQPLINDPTPPPPPSSPTENDALFHIYT